MEIKNQLKKRAYDPNDPNSRFDIAEASEKLVRGIVEDMAKNKDRYSGKPIVFSGKVSNLECSAVTLTAMVRTRGMAFAGVETMPQGNGHGINFDLDHFLEGYMKQDFDDKNPWKKYIADYIDSIF